MRVCNTKHVDKFPADNILVTDLQPNTTYIITVSAVNVVGDGSAAKIRVSTALPSKGVV